MGGNVSSAPCLSSNFLSCKFNETCEKKTALVFYLLCCRHRYDSYMSWVRKEEEETEPRKSRRRIDRDEEMRAESSM